MLPVTCDGGRCSNMEAGAATPSGPLVVLAASWREDSRRSGEGLPECQAFWVAPVQLHTSLLNLKRHQALCQRLNQKQLVLVELWRRLLFVQVWEIPSYHGYLSVEADLAAALGCSRDGTQL